VLRAAVDRVAVDLVEVELVEVARAVVALFERADGVADAATVRFCAADRVLPVGVLLVAARLAAVPVVALFATAMVVFPPTH